MPCTGIRLQRRQACLPKRARIWLAISRWQPRASRLTRQPHRPPRKRRRPLLKEIEQLDRKLAVWHTEKKTLDDRLADPDLYTGSDAGQVPALIKRQGELSGVIDEAEMRWLEAQGEIGEV